MENDSLNYVEDAILEAILYDLILCELSRFARVNWEVKIKIAVLKNKVLISLDSDLTKQKLDK